MVRFIHAADMHLDRSFEGLSFLAPETIATLAKANQQVLTNLVDLALDEQVDFILLAGDTFHQNKPSLKIQSIFFAEMNRLAEAEIPVYLIFGNHDYYDPTRYWFEFPPNMTLFKSETVATIHQKTKAGEAYAISGFSYCQPWIEQEKVSEFPLKTPGVYQIGLYHGEMGSHHYAPFTLASLKEKGYDYWALGHIHVPTTLSSEPPIRYSGTTQGHTKKETQTGVVLVDTNQSQVESCIIEAVKWQKVSISLVATSTQSEALNKVLAELKQVASQNLALISLAFYEGAHLGRDFLMSIKNTELINYLNQQLKQSGLLLEVYEICLLQEETSPPLHLPVSDQTVQELLAQLAKAEQFQQLSGELLEHAIAHQVIDSQLFKEQVLTQTQAKLSEEFTWGGLHETT